MRLSEAPAGAAPSRDVLLGCGARALLGARRVAAAPPAAPLSRLAAASAAEGSKSMGFLKDIAAGTTGGIAVVLVGHPFDTLKVLLQTQPSDKPIYNGVIDAAKVRARPAARRAGRRAQRPGGSGTPVARPAGGATPFWAPRGRCCRC